MSFLKSSLYNYVFECSINKTHFIFLYNLVYIFFKFYNSQYPTHMQSHLFSDVKLLIFGIWKSLQKTFKSNNSNEEVK